MAAGSKLTVKIIACLLALGAMAHPAPAAESTRSGIAALALWSDPVFRSEATGGAAVVASVYGHGGPVIVKSNSPGKLAVDPAGIASAIAAASRGLDPARDVLFLILTSHGGPDGIGLKGGGRSGFLAPDALASLLSRTPVRHKVVIVSACFAGIFTALADDDTLVLTAADATHSSFGCQPEARWTYFGDAFFNQALRHDRSILKAFDDARMLIAARETSQGFTPSNPQMAGGGNVLSILDGSR